MIPYSDSSGCVNLAKGLKQLGITDTKKILSAPLCLNGQVAAGLGGDFPIWTYAIASSLYGDPTDPGMPAYMKVMAKYGTPAVAPDPWVIVTFGQILTTARFLNQIGYGNITPTAVLDKAKAFKGPVALGAPALQIAASTRPRRGSATTGRSSSCTRESTCSSRRRDGSSLRHE